MDNKLPNSYYLPPSNIFVSKDPVEVITILGSCISVCLWDIKEKIGGINHFMLPLWDGRELATPKYGNIAIERLLLKMNQLGSQKKNIIAKIFGGSESIPFSNSVYRVGERNIEIAKRILMEERIQITGESTGSTLARRILFHTSTGEVKMKYINSQVYQIN
jgi:chemotaxis protein CheD